jgi:ComF family protein
MIEWRRVTDALLSALLAPPCAVCQHVLDHPLAGAVCERCWSSIATLTPPATAIGEYDGVLREIVHALKYDGRRSIAPHLARLMARHGAHVLAGADGVVPVPLHPKRERARGFNQADDLARGLGLPVARVLRRVKSTRPQVDLPAADRHRNVKDAFQATLVRRGGPLGPPEMAGAILVLIDDVTTTGATLDACARVLKEAGAREVRALTAARVSSGPR